MVHNNFPNALQDHQRCSLSAKITPEQCKHYRKTRSPSCVNCHAVVEIDGKTGPKKSSYKKKQLKVKGTINNKKWDKERLLELIKNTKTLKELKEKYKFNAHTIKRNFGITWDELKHRIAEGLTI
jgi:hypothetical protein